MGETVVDWQDFKKYCVAQKQYKSYTFECRKRQLLHLIKNCEDICNPDNIYSYFNDRISDGTKGKSLNCYIKALNIFYKYKEIDHHFKLFKNYETPIKVPTKDDIVLLLKNCPRTKTGKMVKTSIFILAHTGLRNKEFCSLTFDDIDWRHNEIRLVGKWDKPRVIPVKPYVLHGKQTPSLRNYIDYHRFNSDDRFIFTKKSGVIIPHDLRKYVKSVARRSGISWIHPHSFRHYYATTLLAHGVNVKVVQKLLGHGNVKITSRYLHANEVDIRRAIKETSFDSLLKGSITGFDFDFYSTNVYGGI